MRNGISKKPIGGQSEEEVAQFWLTHDSTEYVDVSKMEMPNRGRSHIIPVTVPDDEYERLDLLAREEKKTIGELVRQIFQNGLNNLAARRMQ
jgi:hypothetical protein